MSNFPGRPPRTRPWRWLGLALGLLLTSASLSSGFIWACGASCVRDPVVWTPANRGILVLGAAFLAWWGYLFAHYAWTGAFVDPSGHGDDGDDAASSAVESLPVPPVAGVVAGVSILVLGMVIGVFSIRRGDHLLTNLGGVCFLGGFVVAHFFETGRPL